MTYVDISLREYRNLNFPLYSKNDYLECCIKYKLRSNRLDGWTIAILFSHDSEYYE